MGAAGSKAGPTELTGRWSARDGGVLLLDASHPEVARALAAGFDGCRRRGLRPIRVRVESGEGEFGCALRILEPLICHLADDDPALIGAGGHALKLAGQSVAPGTAEFETVVYGLAWLLLTMPEGLRPAVILERLERVDRGSLRVLSVAAGDVAGTPLKLLATVGPGPGEELRGLFPGAETSAGLRYSDDPPPDRLTAERLLSTWSMVEPGDPDRAGILSRTTDALISTGDPESAADIAEAELGPGARADVRTAALVAAARATRILLGRRERSRELTRLLMEESGDRGALERGFLGEVALERVNTVDFGRDSAIEIGAEVLEGGHLPGSETIEGLGWFFACYAMHVAECNEIALGVLDRAVEQASRDYSLPGFVQAVALRSGPLFHLGYLREAAVDCELAIAAGIGQLEVWLPAVRSTLIQVRTWIGDIDGAATIAAWDPGDDESAPSMLFLFGRGVFHAETGDDEAALRDLGEAGRLMELGGGNNPAMMPWRAVAAPILARNGDCARGRELAEMELELATRFGSAGAVGTGLHALAQCEAGDSQRLDLLLAAAGHHRRGQRLVPRLLCEIDLGGELHRSGRDKESRETLRQAMDLAHRSGAAAIAERARSALVAAGGRPRREAQRGPASLTPSEQRVCAMAASGLGNRQIAEKLFVTLKTVEWHLTRSYSKLGIRERAELRRVLADHSEGFRPLA